ncbi:TRAP transporter permease [Cuneatibacter sp. NSJ-177]|uniref:TRAP transporter permease n=1 Tax=Cuneatibacter sp. NSJ-177 TaxID=2931401 RepID=UPI001FD33B14|nr:TRAP transporter permease [Cuneatibacter sp. NSJ-177]MCJ7834084.1 TRAP transporter permease [Cuneatibacter sp. NSJ-177]
MKEKLAGMWSVREEGTEFSSFSKIWDKLIFLISVAFIVFHLYTAYFGVVSGVGQKAVHLLFMVVLLYMKDFMIPKQGAVKKAWNVILLILGAVSILYVFQIWSALTYRRGIIYQTDIIFGILCILGLLVATKRRVAASLAIVVCCFIVFSFVGPWMPGFLKHTGMTLKSFTNVIFLGSEGVFGTALYASAQNVALFVILGAIFEATGVGDFMIQLASMAFGKFTGGPAKVSVIASGFFGSISGSAIANVVGTGTFTIPMMKKVGFDPEFAGAVEATASTGGQIMPPIMGSGAFIMAEMIGVSYFTIVKAAFIPSVLFYLAALLQVHFYAKKHGIKGVAKDTLPDKKNVLKRAYLILPLVFLVVALGVWKWTITRTGFYSIVLAVVLSCFRKETRINFEKFKEIVNNSVNGCITVAVACAIVGVIIGVVMGTGIGVRLSTILIDVAGGKLFLLLALTMVCSLIMGMGMPTNGCYLVLSILIAPALVKMNVSLLAAHLFIFYFGCISSVTPPVALAAYAAAGIAKCNPGKCGIKAFKLAISGFILPFMFIYNPALMLDGSFLNIVRALITAFAGVYCLAGAMERYLVRWEISRIETVVLCAAALLLIDPNLITDVIGIGVAAALILIHGAKDKVKKADVQDA